MTKLQLANLALLALGKSTVTDVTTPGTIDTEIMIYNDWDKCRQELLMAGAWSFASRRYLLNTDTAYTKFLGTGDRTNFITVTSDITWDAGTDSNLVDGVKASNSTDAVDPPASITAGKYILFDFGNNNKKRIEAFKIYGSGSAYGDWIIEASNDDVTYTEQAATFNFTLASSPLTVTCTLTDAAGFRYWRLTKDTGTASPGASVWIQEVEFKIASGTPAFDYDYALDLPTEVLHIIKINDLDSADYPYKLEGKTLLNNDPSLEILCIIDYVDFATWPPHFNTCMISGLAKDLAYATRGDRVLKQLLEAEYQLHVRNALAIDGRQGTHQQLKLNEFLKDR